MRMKSRIAALLFCVCALSAQAQTFPDQPIRIVVGFAPGSSLDTVTRVVAAKLGDELGKPVVVENKPGAGGNIAAEFVARSTPNGYTLLACNTGLAIAPAIYRDMTFDPARDLRAVSQMTSMPHVLVAATNFPANNIAELIALAKLRPGKLNMGSAGVGNADHLAGELFNSMAKVNIVHVPYKGGAQAMADTITGTVAIYFSGLPGAIPMIQAGKVQALGVGLAPRSWALPDVPAIAETLPGFDVNLWYGLMAPAGTSDAVADRIAQAVHQVMLRPDMVETMRKIGADPVAGSPADFQKLFNAEVPRWKALVKEANVRID